MYQLLCSLDMPEIQHLLLFLELYYRLLFLLYLELLLFNIGLQLATFLLEFFKLVKGTLVVSLK
jgi:hypothetical protein